jgi:hypothetical protein
LSGFKLLDLNNPRWSELQHAYGNSSNIPELLRQLAHFPGESSSQEDPWLTLWSSLYHQDDIYSASFAAVPHIIETLSTNSAAATLSFFLLPASIEIVRFTAEIDIPPDLERDYFFALSRYPQLAYAASNPDWDQSICTAALAAIAVATGNHSVAQLLLQTEPDAIPEVIEWLESR